MELETDVGSSMSVAALPGAKLDLLSTVTAEGTKMADLMASADLGPMWAKARNRLMEERKQRDSETGELSASELAIKRERFYSLMRGIAERHIGQFGVTQVEKAFKKVSPMMSIGEIDHFFVDLARVAQMATAATKVKTMIDEMRRGARELL
jgi:hypothetical protein